MPHSKFSQPPHPLVDRNPFRQRMYQPSSILPFAEARLRLPEPVLPEQPGWVEMYWRAWEMAWSNLRRPKADSGFVANFMALPAESISLWDSAFAVQYGWYGRRAFDCMGSLSNFYARQHDDGCICREINTTTGKDFFYPFDPNGAGPNLLAWTEWRYFRATGDDGRLADVFYPLVAYHHWLRANRTWPNGLYWATGLSSGMDNQPRVPDSKYHHRHWSWIDATVQAIVNGRILEQMGALLELPDAVKDITEERVRLIQRVNDKLWNDETNFYLDVDANGRFSQVKSIGAYWALLDAGIIPDARLGPFIQHLREGWAFKVAHRIPSQSADSEGYNAGTGNAWRGGVWPPTNYMVLRGLRNVGQFALAHTIAANHLENVWDVYQHTDTFWENYAPEQAAPGEPARADFVGPSGLSPIAILLEDVIGLSVDWPLRRVTWDRRLETAALYGVRNYPLGQEGTLELLGDQTQVTVNTDVPFTLVIRDGSLNLQTAVPVGVTVIDLT
ncbi:MAG: glycoside hydrolase [Chloroflexi bacterium]|nr:glycoside hydrolase [Chloroflexota bacterium]